MSTTPTNTRLWARMAGIALCALFAVACAMPSPSGASDGRTASATTCPPDDRRLLDDPGDDPLHLAIVNVDLSAVRALLADGADPSGKDGYEDTPLAAAMANRVYPFQPRSPEEFARVSEEEAQLRQIRIQIARELLVHGADPNATSRYGDTALIRLVAARPAFDHDDFIPAFLAFKQAMITMLLEHGADINRANDRGKTPLMSAISDNDRGQAVLVQHLLDHGADPTLTDCEGKTALDLAQSRHQADVARLLQATR